MTNQVNTEVILINKVKKQLIFTSRAAAESNSTVGSSPSSPSSS